MKRTTSIVLLWLIFSYAVQAASFDCAKAQTSVEKLICTDAALSKLDEDLATSYTSTLKANGKAMTIRETQRRWLKIHNTCRDAVCLNTSYIQRIAFLKSHAAQSKSSAGMLNSKGTSKLAVLAPFTFTQNETLPEQAATPVCKDFKNYLNHPRSNELFKPDGTLARESDLFKSVIWESLDKEKYREGFTANLEATHPKPHPEWGVVHEWLRRYASPEWTLQRTLAYPFEYVSKPDQPQRWVFRLVNINPHMRNMAALQNKIELPTWFHDDEEALLGYEDGSPLVGNAHNLVRASPREWITYAGHMYAVINRTYIAKKYTTPSYLRAEIDQLRVDPSRQSYMSFICAYRAKNNQ
jgi:uncharacterized protein